MDARAQWMSELTSNQRKLLTVPEGRRALSRADFKNFCMIYFSDIMKSPATDNVVTISEFHSAFMDDSLQYVRPAKGPAQSRAMWVCPRESGKSTLVRMELIWLGAFMHQSFVAIFSSTVNQAEDMLSNIRSIFDQNELLRKDFPELVKPAKRKEAATMMANNKSLLMQDNGFVLVARGITTSVLGLNIGNMRPSMLVLDDIEASESSTTKNDVATLLDRLQSDIYPLNINAHVLWIGTTTRPGGLVESGVHSVLGLAHDDWVEADNYKVHYYPALTPQDDGTEASMWPERWSTEWLLSQRHTRSFAKNFACLPSAEDSDYWSAQDFKYEPVTGLARTILSIDPAVSTGTKSDFTGISVVSYSPTERKCLVKLAIEVKLPPAELRTKVMQIIQQFPEIGGVLVETNQGGNVWRSIFHDLIVPIETIHQSAKKTDRAQKVLAMYQRGHVNHVKGLTTLETQMMQFPRGVHDDMVDSVGTAVLFFNAQASKRRGTQAVSVPYV